jgi:hypothetical protein
VAIYLKKAIELLNRQIDFVFLQMQMEHNTAICPLLQTALKSGNLQWTGTQVEFVEFVIPSVMQKASTMAISV